MLHVVNKGPDLLETNFFDSAHARLGLFYLSWNASVARLLIPDSCAKYLREMRTGKICIISRGLFLGRDCLELLFDDDSDAPYSIQMEIQQTDRLIADDNKPFSVTAWTRGGKQATWPGKYRVVSELPCLELWSP